MSRDDDRYSKVTRRMWSDADFQDLSVAPPNAQTLWFRLLTGTELTNIPGLFPTRESGLAEALRWPLEGFRSAFSELSAKKMAEADWRAGLVWVPNAIAHNKPTGINTVLSWRRTWSELPECELKSKAHAALREFLAEMGENWANAFEKACPKPKRKATAKPMATSMASSMASALPSNMANDLPCDTQDQEQEQEQDQISSLSEPPPDLPVRSGSRALEKDSAGESGTFQKSEPAPPPTLAERAKAWVNDRRDYMTASFVAPHPETWPELLALERAKADAFGCRADEFRVATDERVLAVLARLAEGYEPAQLESAVRGAAKDREYRSNPQWQNLGTILKSAKNVDRFIALFEAGAGALGEPVRRGQPADGQVFAKTQERLAAARAQEAKSG